MSTQTYSWGEHTTSDATVIDLFAGAGGWEVGAETLQHNLSNEFCGVERDKAVFGTRDLNSLSTIYEDVRNCGVHQFPYARGLVASPPCPTFSIAGKGEGRKLIPSLVAAIRGEPTPELAHADFESLLILQPWRWILHAVSLGRPFNWIALEQVTPVKPVWEAYAAGLAEMNYSVWTGTICAEQYGVPQARRREVLIAKRFGAAKRPKVTHSRYYSDSPLARHPGVKDFVTMADALAWGTTIRPAPVVTGGGTRTGGSEPFGHGARQGLKRDYERGYWRGEERFRPTVREAATLQTFPENFEFYGTKGQQAQQIGNAIPPLLAAHIISEASGVSFTRREEFVSGED